jgi:Zn finger protein HypA/HybF involved in hydrogenase expression
MAHVSCDKCGKFPTFFSQFPIFSCPVCHHHVCGYCSKTGILGFGDFYCPFCKKHKFTQNDVVATS